MVDRDRIFAAQDAWSDAERAYSAEASKYVAVWRAEPPPPTTLEPLTLEAVAKLDELRAAADSARTAYQDVLGET